MFLLEMVIWCKLWVPCCLFWAGGMCHPSQKTEKKTLPCDEIISIPFNCPLPMIWYVQECVYRTLSGKTWRCHPTKNEWYENILPEAAKCKHTIGTWGPLRVALPSCRLKMARPDALASLCCREPEDPKGGRHVSGLYAWNENMGWIQKGDHLRCHSEWGWKCYGLKNPLPSCSPFQMWCSKRMAHAGRGGGRYMQQNGKIFSPSCQERVNPPLPSHSGWRHSNVEATCQPVGQLPTHSHGPGQLLLGAARTEQRIPPFSATEWPGLPSVLCSCVIRWRNTSAMCPNISNSSIESAWWEALLSLLTEE